ncbi:MAG: SDR family NAD(P)-dependent oxidoreductase [Chloroflexota bacterium]|nr:SDR family NAD(P)-dependent oxidoreductase [Chloroflexota bacterium]
MTTARVVLITGAGFGIGRATAELLITHGYRVFGTSRDPKGHGRRAFPLLEMDVHSDESVSNCVQSVLAQGGCIDVLINNAGTGIAGAAEETLLSEARTVFETNFFGMVRMTNAVLPTMRQQHSGKIITMSSAGGFIGIPFRALYVASKFAIEGYNESLRYEVRPFGINVSLVEPGPVSTPVADAVPQVSHEIAAYAHLRRQVTEAFHTAMRQGMPSQQVARAILRIIKQDSPHLHNTVGAQATMLALLRRGMPQGGFEMLVRRIFDMEH